MVSKHGRAAIVPYGEKDIGLVRGQGADSEDVVRVGDRVPLVAGEVTLLRRLPKIGQKGLDLRVDGVRFPREGAVPRGRLHFLPPLCE